MRTRKAILPDARTHSRADLRLLGGRYFAAAYAGGDLRERKRLCGAGTRRPHHWMRCAPPLCTHLAEIRSITVGPAGARSRRGSRLMKALMPKPNGIAWIAFACSRGLRSFLRARDFRLPSGKIFPTRFTRIATSVPGITAAMKSPWCAANFPPRHPPRAGELAGEVAGLTGKRGGQRRPSRDSRFSIIDYRSSSNFRHKKSTDTAANAMIPSGNYTYVNRATEPFCRSFA